MSLYAPLRVPVELKRGQRWFRLAHWVSDAGVELGQAVPDEVEGPLELAFHLPGDPEPIRCHGRAEEMIVGNGDLERAERRQLRFLDLDEAGRARIEAYVQERVGVPG